MWSVSINNHAIWKDIDKKMAARKDADRHQMSVASHTAVPIGTAKWLGLRVGCEYMPSPWVRDTVNHIAYLWQAFPHAQPSFPAISPYLSARLYGWLPTSDTYGIPSLPPLYTFSFLDLCFLPSHLFHLTSHLSLLTPHHSSLTPHPSPLTSHTYFL